MPKSLADGKIKLSLLTIQPADPTKPTPGELNGGTDISCDILASAYTFGPADSDRVNEKALCTVGNTNAIGASNYAADITLFRYYDSGGDVDTGEDVAFQALMTKGTVAWLYERESGKLSTETWANGDEAFGAKVITDEPQKPSDMGGYIKHRIPMEPQDGWFAVVTT